MDLIPEEFWARLRRLPTLTSAEREELLKNVPMPTQGGPFNMVRAFTGSAAMPQLREFAELSLLADDPRSVYPTTYLTRQVAIEVIERIDRGDEPDEVLSLVIRTLRNRRSGRSEVR